MTVSSANETYLEKQTFIATYNGKTLYVGGSGPGNYTSIQEAIDDAENGDTVFVYDESSPYYEYLIINTSIDLIGESRDGVFVNGTDTNAVIINSSWVNISNISFVPWYNSNGIVTDDYDNINIDNCYIDKCHRHIKFQNTENDNINNCYFNWTSGISVEFDNATNINITNCEFNIVDKPIKFNNVSYSNILNCKVNDALAGIDFGNLCSNNTIDNYTHTGRGFNNGIRIHTNCTNNILSNNIITNVAVGILMGIDCNYTKIFGNILDNNRYGIWLTLNAENNTIYENNISNSSKIGAVFGYGHVGDWGHPANNNVIYHNNFIDNTESANDTDSTNQWNNLNHGNYWDNYDEPSEEAWDNNSDGIADNPYILPGNYSSQDLYPLMEPYGSKPKKIVGTTGPLCPLLNIAEIDLIDGNSSQIKKIERILNNRILHFILPITSINVTGLNFSVSYNRKNPSPFILYLRFFHITVVTENGNNTFYNETHTVTVKGLDGVFSFMRWKLRRLIPARFVFYGEYDEVMIEYHKGE